MSKGISWRQRWMLSAIARLIEGRDEREKGEPVAWCDIDYGPTSLEGDADYHSQRVQWNIEQAQRRSLRSLERRGLVQLDRYCFVPEPGNGMFMGIVWSYIHPDDYVPGEMRMMTGVLLTDAGRAYLLQSDD